MLRYRPSSPALTYAGESHNPQDTLLCALQSVETIGELSTVAPTPRSAVAWERALALCAERRFDVKPAARSIDLRQLARMVGSSVRSVIERLQLEHPSGWISAGPADDPLDAAQALPLQVALRYWLPVRSAPTLR